MGFLDLNFFLAPLSSLSSMSSSGGMVSISVVSGVAFSGGSFSCVVFCCFCFSLSSLASFCCFVSFHPGSYFHPMIASCNFLGDTWNFSAILFCEMFVLKAATLSSQWTAAVAHLVRCFLLSSANMGWNGHGSIWFEPSSSSSSSSVNLSFTKFQLAGDDSCGGT